MGLNRCIINEPIYQYSFPDIQRAMNSQTEIAFQQALQLSLLRRDRDFMSDKYLPNEQSSQIYHMTVIFCE